MTNRILKVEPVINSSHPILNRHKHMLTSWVSLYVSCEERGEFKSRKSATKGTLFTMKDPRRNSASVGYKVRGMMCELLLFMISFILKVCLIPFSQSLHFLSPSLSLTIASIFIQSSVTRHALVT